MTSQSPSTMFGRRLRILMASSALLVAAACGGGSGGGSDGGGGGVTPGTPSFTGSVIGGQQPVSGSEVSAYAAGEGLLNASRLACVKTDGSGNFVFAAGGLQCAGAPPTDFVCPESPTQIYLIAKGGDPGNGSNNPAILMMGAIGPCSSIRPSTFVNINEVTTVASVYALAAFINSTDPTLISAVNGDSTSAALAGAFATVGNLADVSKG